MRDTMAHLNGAGLAAPQIGVLLRVVIFGVKSNPRYPDVEEVPDTVLINPELKPLSDELEEGWEGCLSVPGMRGWVPRWHKLHYKGRDEKGMPFERTVEGFFRVRPGLDQAINRALSYAPYADMLWCCAGTVNWGVR